MRTNSKLLALALVFSASALFSPAHAQSTAASASTGNPDPAGAPPPPAAVTSDEPAPQMTPRAQENDAQPEPAQAPPDVAVEPPSAPTAAPATAAPEPAPAPERKSDITSGKVVSATSSSLVLEGANGARLTFVVDQATSMPDLKVGDAVSVEYVAEPDGTKHAHRVTLATPQRAVVAPAAPRVKTPPPAKPTPAVEAPAASVAVTPPVASVPPPAEGTPAAPSATAAAADDAAASAALAADAATSGASTDDPAEHTLSPTPAPEAVATKAERPMTPSRMAIPLVLLAAGLTFITVLGVRQARHPV